MTWRRVTPHARKAYWDGPGWPDEVSALTREHAATAGWDAAGWAACRNAGFDPALDAWFDDLPVFAAPVPALVVAEMVDRSGTLEIAFKVLDAVVAGVPPCVAWTVAEDYRALLTPLGYWEIGEAAGLTPDAMSAWWRTGMFFALRHLPPGADPVAAIAAEVNPWIDVYGPNAHLWALWADHPPKSTRSVGKPGRLTEADLRARLDKKERHVPVDVNDHGAAPHERSEFEKGNWDEKWVTPQPGQDDPEWTGKGWPPEIPEQTPAAAASAGWTVQDWIRLHTKARGLTRKWLWNMPLLPEPLAAEAIENLMSPYTSFFAAGVLDQIAAGIPQRFVFEAGDWAIDVDPRNAGDRLRLLWDLVQDLGMTEAEAFGWLLTGKLYVPVRKWESGEAEGIVTRKIGPWRDKYGPTAYLWVLAGVGLREAARSVKNPGWDDDTLRTMVALNGVVLPAGV